MQRSTRRAILMALVLMSSPVGARSETVYEFVSHCREDQLGDCFNQISDQLDRVRNEAQGHAFCMPCFWGGSMTESGSYPVSVLEYIRLGLSAARFGSSGRPADAVISEMMGKLYPCN